MATNDNRPAAPSLSEQEQIRRAKLQALFDQGESPYLLTKFPVDAHSAEIKGSYDRLDTPECSATS